MFQRFFTIIALCSFPCAAYAVDIFGTHYSAKLDALISKVERATHKKVVFERNSPDGDNFNEHRGNSIVIKLRPGSAEDDAGHELVHSLIEMEGYPRWLHIPGIRESEALEKPIASDMDHLIINKRELREGYDALHGFLLPMRDHYRSDISALTPPPNFSAINRALYDIVLIHQLIGFVYYFKIAPAEPLILSAHPNLVPYWNKLKPKIEQYLSNVSPDTGWRFSGDFADVMDSITWDSGLRPKFSEVVGVMPFPCSAKELRMEAESVFWVADIVDRDIRRYRVFKGKRLIGFSRNNASADLSLTVAEFLEKYRFPHR